MDCSTKYRINLSYLHHNISKIMSYKKGEFMFVLKSNSYGFGYKEILNELETYDRVKYIGVALPNEALFIRKYTSKQIVVLGYTNDEMLNRVVKENIIPSVFEMRQAELLEKNAKVFINLDTGFHRLGANRFEFDRLYNESSLSIEGVFTHLRLIDEDSDNLQISTFFDWVKGKEIPYVSISDSIGFSRYDTNENLYRIGAALFGYTSVSEETKLDLKQMGQLETRVTRVEEINEDTSAFYRSSLHKGQKVATIQIGYGDGLLRTMPDECYVVLNGKRCRYIEVGMDQSIIDVGEICVNVGDKVVIFGEEGMSLNEYATYTKTNKNNILTMIQSRVVREYIKDGRIVKRVGLLEERYENQ